MYVCKICGKRYRDFQYIYEHMVRHHGVLHWLMRKYVIYETRYKAKKPSYIRH